LKMWVESLGLSIVNKTANYLSYPSEFYCQSTITITKYSDNQ
jgi:hypothetical protein